MARGGRRTQPNLAVRPLDVRRRLMKAESPQRRSGNIATEWLANRLPIHFGGMSDPFESEPTKRLSQEILRYLFEFNYPVVLSTKRPEVLLRGPLSHLLQKPRKMVVQVSIPFLSRTLAAALEPNVDSPANRIVHSHHISEMGFRTVARIQPIFISEIEAIANDLVPLLAKSGFRHVILEFLKLPVERNLGMTPSLCKALRKDIYAEYAKLGATSVGREWLLPSEVKWNLLQPIIKSASDLGLTFSLADYGLYHLGNAECCCGTDGVPGFEQRFTANFSTAIRRNRTKRLSFASVSKSWTPRKSMRKYLNSNSRIDGGTTVLQYLRDKWNRPGSTNAPDSFLGVLCQGKKDQNGDYLYEIEKR